MPAHIPPCSRDTYLTARRGHLNAIAFERRQARYFGMTDEVRARIKKYQRRLWMLSAAPKFNTLTPPWEARA